MVNYWVRAQLLLETIIPYLLVCFLISIPFVIAYAWTVRKRYPLLLPRLLAIAVAMFLNVAMVFLCLGVFQQQCLDLLPFACGDGAIGDAMIYLFGGYAMSLAGLVAYRAYAILLRHWPRTVRTFAVVSSAAVLMGILALMIVAGRRQGGYLLYWFVIVQTGFFVMLLADTIACGIKRQLEHTR